MGQVGFLEGVAVGELCSSGEVLEICVVQVTPDETCGWAGQGCLKEFDGECRGLLAPPQGQGSGGRLHLENLL